MQNSSEHARATKGAIVITGGSRGIGAQVALRAARSGIPVAILYRSQDLAAQRVVDEVHTLGGRAMALATDIGVERAVLHAFALVDEAFGGVCGLVNSAVDAGSSKRLVDLDAETLEAVFRTNVFGAFFCSREAARRMSTSRGGAGGGIVTLSSAVAVKTGGPVWTHFAASKGALETMSLGMAKELAAEGVRVNVVRCGVIATETRLTQPKEYIDRMMSNVPMGRMGTPEEVAGVISWLLSPDAAYVTGAAIDVTGGL